MALFSPRRRIMRLTLLVGLCAFLLTLAPVQSLRSANVVAQNWYEEGSLPFWSAASTPPPRVPQPNDYGAYGSAEFGAFNQYAVRNNLLQLGVGQSPYEAAGGLSAVEAGFANLGGSLPGSAERDPALMALLVAELQRADQLVSFGKDLLRDDGDINTYLAGRTFPVNWTAPEASVAWLGGTAYTPPFLQELGQFGNPALAQTGDLAAIAARYNALADEQLAFYYNNADLSGLRSELNRYLLNYIALDPHYLYWAYELQRFEEQTRASRPSAAELNSLAAQIATWTSAPADETQLRSRYSTRLRYLQFQAAVDAEFAAYLDANPTAKQRYNELRRWLRDRLDAIWNQPETIIWFAGWQKRWRAFYYGSAEAARQVAALQQIEADYGAFTEYLRLSDELIDLLPAFDELPTVANAAATTTAANSDVATRQAREGYAQNYRDSVTGLLASTAAPQTLERYYSSLAGLVLADPTYAALQADEAGSTGAFAAYQQRVHAAMANCYNAQSVLCNGYDDPAVLNLLAGAASPVGAAGAYYERSNRFWYSFYTSTAYQTLETATRSALEAPLGGIAAQLAAARSSYQAQVNNLPAMRNAATASASAITSLCTDRASRSSLPVVEATRAFCERIERLAELNDLLAPAATNMGNENKWLYLPMMILEIRD
jgi:hypothetical protein